MGMWGVAIGDVYEARKARTCDLDWQIANSAMAHARIMAGVWTEHGNLLDTSGTAIAKQRSLDARRKCRAHPKEIVMSNASKRIAGAAEELGGKIKGGAGKLIGNKQMQVSGKAREIEGKVKLQLAKAADRVKVKL